MSQQWLELLLRHRLPLVKPCRHIDIYDLVKSHIDIEGERIIFIILESEAIIKQQKEVASLPVEVIHLVAFIDCSSYVVVECNIGVGFHPILYLFGRFEPSKVFVFILIGTVLILFFFLLSLLDHLLYWIDHGPIFHQIIDELLFIFLLFLFLLLSLLFLKFVKRLKEFDFLSLKFSFI